MQCWSFYMGFGGEQKQMPTELPSETTRHIEWNSLQLLTTTQMATSKLKVCISLGLLTFLNLLLLSPPSNSSFVQNLSPECDAVITDLDPCAQFIRDAEATPNLACCIGVRNLADMARRKSGVKEICECLKEALDGSIYDPARIPDLPRKCEAKFNLPPVEHNTDCTK